jgi:hypothetical protein
LISREASWFNDGMFSNGQAWKASAGGVLALALAAVVVSVGCVASVSTAQPRGSGPGGSAPVVSTASTAASDPSPSFRLEIEQDGLLVAASGARVKIARRPFSVIVWWKLPGATMLQASDSPVVYRAATGDRTGLRRIFHPYRAMAEKRLPDRELILRTDSVHYLYFDGGAEHRCHSIRRRGAWLGCERRVELLTWLDPHRSVPVEHSTMMDLYLVAVAEAPKGTKKPDLVMMQVVFR